MAADRVLVLEVVAGHRVAQDHHRRRRGRVGGLERSADADAGTDRFEVAAADDARHGLRRRRDRILIRPLDPELPRLRERPGERRGRRHGRGLDRRLGPDALEDVARELHAPVAVRHAEVLGLQAEDVREIEPGIDRVETHQRAREQSGADEQHERRRELADDERALRAAPADAAGGPSPAACHRAHRVVQEAESRRPGKDERHADRDRPA